MLPVLAETSSNLASQVNTALETNVAPSGLVDQVVGLMPWIGAMVLVVFLIYEVRKLGKGASKGKLKY